MWYLLPVCSPLLAPQPGHGQRLVCQGSAHPPTVGLGRQHTASDYTQQLLIYLAVKLNRGGEPTDDIMVIHLTSWKT